MPARLLTLIFFLLLCAPASAEICDDCGDGGGGGGTTTYAIPDTTWVSGVWGDVNVKRPSQTFKSDLSSVSYRCRFAPAGNYGWAEDGAFDCGSTEAAGSTTTFTPGWDVPDGQYTFQMRACKRYTASVTKCDPSPALRGVYIDTVAPTLTITGLADGDWRKDAPTVGFASPDGGSAFLCATSPGAELVSCDSGYTYPAGTPDGHHQLRVKVRDGAGNESAIATIDWTKDTTAPIATLGGAEGTVTTPRPEIWWNVEDLDEDVWESCRITGPTLEIDTDCEGGHWMPEGDLPEGAYTFALRLGDRNGHVTEGVTRHFTIDLPDASGPGTGGGDAATGGDAPSTVLPSPTPASDGPAAPAATPSTPGTAPAPVVTSAAKKAVKKKRCRTVKKKLRGKTRKVRVCKKAKKRKRAAATRRA